MFSHKLIDSQLSLAQRTKKEKQWTFKNNVVIKIILSIGAALLASRLTWGQI